MSSFIGDLENNGLSDEMNESTSLDNVQGLDDYIENGMAFENNFDEINFSNDSSESKANEIENPNKFVENSFKRQYKSTKKIESTEKLEGKEKLENPMDVREVKEMDGSLFNDTPDKDIQESFDYVDLMYDKDSTEWQENACRYVESLEGQLSDLLTDYDKAKEDYINAQKELELVVSDNGLTPNNCKLNENYNAANEKYIIAKDKFESIDFKKSNIESKIDAVKPYIKNEMKSTFKGFDNSNFKDSYNPFITNKQGEAVEDAAGTCSINAEACTVNQQLGTTYTEKEMVEEFKSEGQCTYKEVNDKMTDDEKIKTIASNGGTIYEQRAYMAKKHGLSYYAETGNKSSLEKMATKMDDGFSLKIGLKAQDLSQSDLAPRHKKFGLFGVSKVHDDNKANHMVTVSGFSYGKDGTIKGLWVNDTGGFTSSNRVFISSEKFNEMAKKTPGFSVEYCKDINKMDNSDMKSLSREKVNTHKSIFKDLSNSELGKINSLGNFSLNEQKFESNQKIRLDGISYRTDDSGKIHSFYSEESKEWKLIPNNNYEVNGYKYETNEKGQIISCSGPLHLKEHEGRKNISDHIPNRLENDDRGHLIADMFDGSNKIDNIVPMNSDLNQKEYKSLEMRLKDSIDEGKQVFVDIKVKYDSNGRPSKFTVTSMIDGLRERKVFINDIGGNKK